MANVKLLQYIVVGKDHFAENLWLSIGHLFWIAYLVSSNISLLPIVMYPVLDLLSLQMNQGCTEMFIMGLCYGLCVTLAMTDLLIIL
jgi:hypothetical protein